jgi:hypothetical protein
MNAHLRFFGARNSFRQIVDNGPLLRNKFRAPMCPCEWPSKNLRCALGGPVHPEVVGKGARRSRRFNLTLTLHKMLVKFLRSYS